MSNLYGKRQKARSFVKFKQPRLKFGNVGILAISSGFLNSRMVSNFFIRFKKIFKFNKSLTKFWYNLFCSYIITKKALNVRMGKGKGSRKGRVCYVKSGRSIIEMSYCRLGIILYLYKYVRVRCSFKVNYIFNRIRKLSIKNKIICNELINKKNKFVKVKNKYFIRKRIAELLESYKSTKKLTRARIFAKVIKRYFFKFKYLRLKRLFKVLKLNKNYCYYTKVYKYFSFFLRKRFWYYGNFFVYSRKFKYSYIFDLEGIYSKFYNIKFRKIKIFGIKREFIDMFKVKSIILNWVNFYYTRNIAAPLYLYKMWGFTKKEIRLRKKSNSLKILSKKILYDKRFSKIKINEIPGKNLIKKKI